MMYPFREKIKHKVPLQRVYIIFSAVMAALVLAAFLVQLRVTQKIMYTHTNQMLTSAHEQSADLLAVYWENLESTLRELCYSPSVQHLLESDDGSKFEYYTEVKQLFSVLSYVEPDIASFALYDAAGQRVMTSSLTGGGFQTVILSDSTMLPNSIQYTLVYPPNRYIGITQPLYVISLPILEYSSQSSKPVGALLVTARRQYIQSVLEANLALEGSAHILTDASGEVIVATNNAFRTDSGMLDEMLLSRQQFSLYTDFEDSGWKLYSVMAASVVTDDMRPLLYSTVITWLLVLGMIIAVLILFQKGVLRPVRRVSHFMRHASDGSRSEDGLSVISYKDKSLETFEEFYVMEHSMNQMLDHLHQQAAVLLEQEKRSHEAELLARQMEILAYRSQINPHFLYNTLDCIRGIALSRGASEIVEISQSLSMIFRYVIKGGDFAALGQELEHLREYGTIIHHRFMGRIAIQVETAPEIERLVVPRLILQPLVENAVFHGLEGKRGKGEILVCLEEIDGRVHVRVSDNGLGISEETLAELYSSIHTAPEPGAVYHVGLANIAHRLRIYDPEMGDIHITSVPGQGTTVELIIKPIEEATVVCTE